MKKGRTSEDIKTFKNPSDHWEHHGAFSVELVEGTDTRNAPWSAEVNGYTVTLRDGFIMQSPKGVQLTVNGQPFYWAYSDIKVISDGEGQLLWVNDDFR